MTETEWVEERLANHPRIAELNADERRTLRAMLRREWKEDERWGELSNRDYSPYDAGEPPKGAKWE